MQNLRHAMIEDIERIADIEQRCFKKAEAATLESFKERFAVFPECFFVLEVDGKIVGHINGCINDRPKIPDELFKDASLHRPDGKFQTVFGLAVAPEYQNQGCASLLVKHFVEVSRKRGLEGIVLTCKEHLIGFYEKHGFILKGKSVSNHGGAEWYDMLILL